MAGARLFAQARRTYLGVPNLITNHPRVAYSTFTHDLSGESGKSHTYGWSAPITAFGLRHENYFQWPEVTDR